VSKVVCRALCKAFDSRSVVLDGLDLEVPDESIVAVLGESGSGKTTLLRLIAGFDRPDAGTIVLDGEMVDSARRFVSPDRRRIGFVSQEGNLFPHLTVAGNVGFGLSRRRRASARVGELLEVAGLAELSGRYPHELSGGQQQRVALARALAPSPRLVLLDEPFSSLDASLRGELRSDVMRILRERDATAILVTHDQSEALSVADLVGVIANGQIRQLATPQTLYSRPANAAIARFIGEANILAGTASSGVVQTTLGPLSATAAGGDGSLAGPVTVLVRPEQISLAPLSNSRLGNGGVAGRVLAREYYGHDCLMLLAVNGEKAPLRVRCLGDAAVQIGEEVTVSASGAVIAWPAG
jgi:iron(III) transport system ATP-binding protein